MKHACKVPYAPDLPGTILFTSQDMTLCIFMNINMYIYSYTHIFIPIYLHIYSICTRIYIFMYTNIFISIYCTEYAYICIYLRTCLDMGVPRWEWAHWGGEMGVGRWGGDGRD